MHDLSPLSWSLFAILLYNPKQPHLALSSYLIIDKCYTNASHNHSTSLLRSPKGFVFNTKSKGRQFVNIQNLQLLLTAAVIDS